MNSRRDSGFTLIEILIVVSLIGMVMSVVASAIVVTMFASKDSNQSLLESQALGFTSGFITSDVASANEAPEPDVANCPDSGTGEIRLALEWVDITESVLVDYRFDSAHGTLRRYEYRGGGGCATPTETTVVATSISDVTATVVTESGRQGVRVDLSGPLVDAPQSITAYRRLP